MKLIDLIGLCETNTFYPYCIMHLYIHSFIHNCGLYPWAKM